MTKRRYILIALIIALCIAGMLIGRWILISYPIYEANLQEKAQFTLMPEPVSGEKILIFAPHEDDETLGCAGYIQHAVAAGADVHVVLMTNGEYPEVDVFLFEETLKASPQSFIRLGYMRQKETLAAMKYLGVPAKNVTFLGYPNQYLYQMWAPVHWLPNSPVQSNRTKATHSPYNNSFTPQTIYCGQSMLNDVEAVLAKEKPGVVIAIHPNDIHVDHWPTGAVVSFALNELTARRETFAGKSKLYTYLIHRDWWPVPRTYRPYLNLEPPEALVETGMTRWLSLPLTREQTLQKHQATSLYRTQAGSYDPLLLSFARRNELFGDVPACRWPHDSTVSPEVVTTDPIADRLFAAEYPSKDIRFLSMSRDSDMMTVEITTRGKASPKTPYHFSIHAGGKTASDRTVIDYDWQGDKASGWIVQDDTLSRLDPNVLKSSIEGNRTILQTPWPLMRPSITFFIVRAWTSNGRITIDETASTVLEIDDQKSLTLETIAQE